MHARFLAAAALALLPACATTSPANPAPEPAPISEAPPEAPPHDHGGQPVEATGTHKGPLVHRFTDPEAFAVRWESPERAEWQKPAELVAAMGITEGMTVADIGAGTGYFLPWLQEAVGPQGAVLAVDIEPAMLTFIDGRIQTEGWSSVSTVLATPEGPGLAQGSVDRMLIVDTWHHIPDREAYSGALLEALKPGGQVYVVDFTQETTKGPAAHHRLSPDVVMAELRAGGLKASLLEEDLPDQYVVVGHKAP